MKMHRLPLLIVGIAALVAGLWSTGGGLNPNMDSFWYFVYARSFATGQGLTAPINSWSVPEIRLSLSQWPPLYPLFLSIGGPDILPWAHLSSILLPVISALLIYAIGVRLSGQRLMPVMAALLFLATPSVTQTAFSAAGSEALFVPLVLAAAFCLTYFRSGEHASWFAAMGAAGMLSLAVMTRYAGIGFVVMALIYLARWARTTSQSDRWLKVAAMLIPGIPLAGFALYLYQTTGSWTGLQPASGALTLNDIPGLLRTVALEMLSGLRWLLLRAGIESNLPALAGGAILVAALFGRLWQIYRARGSQKRGLPGSTPAVSSDALWLLVLYIAGYTLSLWALSVRSDAIFSGEPRHTVVLYPALWLLVGLLVQAAQIPHWLSGALLVIYLAGGIAAWEQSRAGLEYNTPPYRALTAALIELKTMLPPDTLIHAEDAAYLSFYLGDSFPVRTFAADAIREGYSCDDLIFPAGYSHALFVALDSPIVYELAFENADTLLQAWSIPCGTPHPMLDIAGIMRATLVDLK